MSERKINLEELFNNNFDCYTEIFEHSCKESTYEQALSKAKFKELCLEFGKQLLELVSKNVNMIVTENDLAEEGQLYTTYDDGVVTIRVNGKSILDTIKQVE